MNMKEAHAAPACTCWTCDLSHCRISGASTTAPSATPPRNEKRCVKLS